MTLDTVVAFVILVVALLTSSPIHFINYTIIRRCVFCATDSVVKSIQNVHAFWSTEVIGGESIVYFGYYSFFCYLGNPQPAVQLRGGIFRDDEVTQSDGHHA
jgi:hypothetical protein